MDSVEGCSKNTGPMCRSSGISGPYQIDLFGRPASNARPSSPEGSRANRSARPGTSEAARITVTSGLKCYGSCRSAGPLGLLEKTCLGSSLWHSKTFVLTWSVYTMPSGRSLYRLLPLEHRTSASDVSLWRTPGSREAGTPKSQAGLEHESEHRPNRLEPNNLIDQVACRLGLRLWPTPNTGGGHCVGRLDEMGGSGNPYRGTEIGKMYLDPSFLEWLMGFPIGHTESEPSETPSSLSKSIRSSKGSRTPSEG